MRIIILDDSGTSRAAIRKLCAELDPDVEVSEYDAEQRGQPGPGFDWSVYDLAVIGDRVAQRESGLAWLLDFRRHPAFPPALVLASQPDPYVERRALGLDHVGYVDRRDINRFTLRTAVARLGIHLDDPERTGQRPQGLTPADRALVEALGRGRIGPADTASDATEYRFVRLIGQGAHSRVYLAERSTDRHTLVMKVLDLSEAEDERVVRRFAREAELMWTLRNRYVVRVYDHGFTAKQGFIAMEFFTRGDLKQRIQHGMDVTSALLNALQIALGLEAIHVQGIIHRDLKPSNIMFRSDDSLAIADFGISKRLNESWALTRTGTILGTLNYLSPEQGLGQELDCRSDLYAVGMILFEMLTGQKAFHAASPGALIYQHLHAEIPRLPEHLAQYQYLIDRLLAKDRENRFGSASELVVNLEQALAADGTRDVSPA